MLIETFDFLNNKQNTDSVHLIFFFQIVVHSEGYNKSLMLKLTLENDILPHTGMCKRLGQHQAEYLISPIESFSPALNSS